jgi:hypothetical protein
MRLARIIAAGRMVASPGEASQRQSALMAGLFEER